MATPAETLLCKMFFKEKSDQHHIKMGGDVVEILEI